MKTIQILSFILVLSSVALKSSVAFAEGSFAKLALYYSSKESEESGSTSKSTRMVYDVSAYYKFQGGGWVLGALYQNDNASETASVDRTSYGVSGGWMTPRESGFYLLGTYFVSSKYGDYDGGNGYQLDIGYKVPTRVPLTFQFSYKHYDYSKYDHSDTLIDPYFGLMIMF
ncbi:hypothetical protein ACLVWU_01480 [Bdellovibrio sp. HCB290]|uniref:hypothetical protein n=1 Tax=Bdellovibrio sp. HCB290 TaxID=3394356 RepID=UPI0039B5A5B5